VASGVTLGGVAEQLSLTGKITKVGRSKVDGQPVIGLRGGLPPVLNAPAGLQATLFVAATGKPLPVQMQGGIGSNAAQIEFSKWGERVAVSAPATTVPASVVMSGQR
jgi:hypothetical protein